MKQNYKPLSVRRLERKSKNKMFISLVLGAFLIYALFSWILPTVIGSLSLFKKSPNLPKQVLTSDNKVLAPPVLNIPYESTNTAQINIKGYASPDVKVEIYLDDNLKTTSTTNSSGDFTSSSIDLSLGTNNIYGKSVDDKGNKSLASKTISIIYDHDKPKLDISSPQDNLVLTTDKKVTVSGVTNDDGNTVVTINGLRAILSPDGSFSEDVNLNDGENMITIDAKNQSGNTTEIIRKVTYNSASPTPTPIVVK